MDEDTQNRAQNTSPISALAETLFGANMWQVWRLYAAVLGILILYLLGLALVFNSRLDGGTVSGRIWFFSLVFAVLGTALVGLAAFRYSTDQVNVTQSRLLTIFVLAGSAYLVFAGLCIVAWSAFDWDFDMRFELFMFLVFFIGPVLGTVTAVEWHRIAAKGGIIRVASLAIAFSSYLLCAFWIFALFFFRFGSSVI